MASIWNWSSTAGDNATADSLASWPEGMAPGLVNDSARGIMKRVADLLKDLGGVAAAGGTANALTLTTYNGFTAHFDGLIVTLRASATNTDEATLNVNGVGTKPIVKMTASGETALEGGELQSNGIYELVYSTALNGAAGAWLLVNPSFAPIPVGSVIEYYGTTAPDGFLFPYGQAVSRTTYAALFAKLGTSQGVGDGSTTFNLPDRRGRAAFGKDDMGGTAANRLTGQTGGLDGATLGATGGEETHTLTEAQLPSITPTFTGSPMSAHGHPVEYSVAVESSTQSNTTGGLVIRNTGAESVYPANTGGASEATGKQIGGASAGTPAGTVSSFGSDAAHNNLPPGIVCNFLIKT